MGYDYRDYIRKIFNLSANIYASQDLLQTFVAWNNRYISLSILKYAISTRDRITKLCGFKYFDDLCKMYICNKYLATSMYIFSFILNFTVISMMIVWIKLQCS